MSEPSTADQLSPSDEIGVTDRYGDQERYPAVGDDGVPAAEGDLDGIDAAPPLPPVDPGESSGIPDQVSSDVSACPCTVPADRAPLDLPGAQQWAPNGSLLVSADGETYDLGVPTIDVDGDGRNDATVVPGDAGQYYLVVDLTGDLVADGMLLVDGDGTVLTGFEWDAQGNPVAVDIPAGMDVAAVLGSRPDAVAAPVPDGSAPSPEDGAPLTPEDTSVPPAQDAVPAEGDDTGVADQYGGPGANVVLETAPGGELIDLGPATLDLDGDGVNDAVVVPDDTGAPAYVVSELRSDGRGDLIVILDPATMEPTAQFVMVEGVEQPDGTVAEPEGAVIDSTAPGEPATGGPEKIVAPGSDYSNPSLAMVSAASQGYYDIASEVWFELTGGEPYPRTEDGTPLDPGTVFLTLAQQDGVGTETSEQLLAMAEQYQMMLQRLVQGM